MSSGVYGLRLLAKPRVQRTALAIVVSIVLAYRLIQFLGWLREPVWGYDFAAYWAAAGHLLHGQPIYTPEQLSGPFVLGPANLYQYPPALAAFLVPFATLLPADARLVNWLWLGLGAVVLTASVVALARHERLADRFALLRGRRWAWWLVAALFAFPPVIDELVVGNVNALLVGLFAATWLGLERRDAQGGPTAGGEAVAALAIGFATVIKLFPALLVLWLLLVGRRRAALWSIAATAAIAAVTLPITGLQPWLDYVSVARNLSINLAQPDALAPTFWLTPYLGFTVARIVVTILGLALLVWVTRSDPRRYSPDGHIQEAPRAAAPRAAAPRAAAPRAAAPRAASARVAAPPAEAPRPEASRPEAPPSPRLSFATAILVSILVTPTLYGSYLTVTVVPMLLALAAGVPLAPVAIAYVLMWGGEQETLGDLGWIVQRLLPTFGVLLLLGAVASIGTVRRRSHGTLTTQP